MNIPKLPISLVLSSGGAKGYAHIGAIKAIEESGYIITSIAGTSMGALVVDSMPLANSMRLMNG